MNCNKILAGDSASFSNRVYTDTTHTYDNITNEAFIERNPLENVFVNEDEDGAVAKGYDKTKGAYLYEIDGFGFNEAYYDKPTKEFKVNALIKGDNVDRTIYVRSFTETGALECAALLDDKNALLPIPLEVSKNFTGEMEEALYYPDDASYGETVFPLCVKKEDTLDFTLINLYQNWGKFALKQLSSIQFCDPYYHLSIGVTETNCIAPFYFAGKNAWLLPDFRSLSSPMWPTQPQHTSVGCLYFLKYKDAEGNYLNSEHQSSEIKAQDPCMPMLL